MNVLSPRDPGSWLSFWLHFGPWGLGILLFVAFAVVALVYYSRREAERRALRAWHLDRLVAWRERRQQLEPAMVAIAEAFTQQIEIVVVPSSIHSTTDRSE